MSRTTSARFCAAVVVIAPALLLLGFAYDPYVTIGTDEAPLPLRRPRTRPVGDSLTSRSESATRSWRSPSSRSEATSAKRARSAGGLLGLPFAVFGSCLFIPLTGMEFALLAAAETGGDVEAVQEELFPWFVPLLAAGALSFTLGAVCFAFAVARSSILGSLLTRVVVAGFVVMSLARFVPLGAAQIVIGVSAVVALWPIADKMWRDPSPNTATALGA